MKSKDAWKRRIGILLILLLAITTAFDETALFAKSSESGTLGKGAAEQGKTKKEKDKNEKDGQKDRGTGDPYGWEDWEWDSTDPHDIYPNWDEMTPGEQLEAWMRWRISRLLDPTVSPTPTGDPEPTTDPEPTVGSEPTAEPTTDPEPTVGSEPTAEPTTDPEPTVGSEPTAEPTTDPVPTVGSEPTTVPEPTEEPQPTGTVPTRSPQPTVTTPQPTADPEPIVVAQPTYAPKTPVPTEEPQPTAGPEPADITPPAENGGAKNTDVPPASSQGFGAVSIKGKTLDELAQLLLTEEELALYNSGVELTVEVKLVDITSIVNEEVRNIIKSRLPEGYKEGVYFSAALIKQLAGSDAVRVLGENTMRIAFEIPEAIRMVTNTAEATRNNSYRLYKVYSDTNGKSDIEEVEVAVYDEYTMEADIDTSEDAEYVIIYDATVPAGSGEMRNDPDENGEQDIIITGTGENAHVFTSETLVEEEPEPTEKPEKEIFTLAEKLDVAPELQPPDTGQDVQKQESKPTEQEEANSEKGFVIFNILLAVITLVLVGMAYVSKAEYKRFQRVTTIVCAIISVALILLTTGFSYIAAADLWTIALTALAAVSLFVLVARKSLKE